MRIRPLTAKDEPDARALYIELTYGPKSASPERFAEVLAHSGTTVFGAEVEGRIRAMATLHLLPNVTWGGRPYGLVENVVTARAYRMQGLARAVIAKALETAQSAGAYKVMLQTGHTRGAIGFYGACGFSDRDKVGMQVRWT